MHLTSLADDLMLDVRVWSGIVHRGVLAGFGHRAPGGVGCLRAGRGVRLLRRL